MKINIKGFSNVKMIMACGIAALFGVIVMIALSASEPRREGILQTLCIGGVRVLIGPDGKFKELIDQNNKGIACTE